MYRKIENYLSYWKNSKFRTPLIIRGARQVGKSFIVQKFGKSKFKSYVEINFEATDEAKSIFNTLNPDDILSKIEVAYNQRVTAGETLIFLDEIQECPEALKSLRYFKENYPELHIIAAGSLLEFYLQDNAISFPVGRVEFIHLVPMSFKEFLIASKEEILIEQLEKCTIKSPPSDITHNKALKLLKSYSYIGGMPAVVKRYLDTKSFFEAKQAQDILSDGYQHDFLKYKLKNINVPLLTKTFIKAPILVGKHFKYTYIDKEIRSREIKEVLRQLCWAGVIRQVFATKANGIPLNSEQREHRFKLLLLDIGLLHNFLSVNIQELFNKNIEQVNSGQLSEQIVGQELIAMQSPKKPNIFFWEKETRGSSSEVDYLFEFGTNIIPIEVKAGITGRKKSLKVIMSEKNLTHGVVISSRELSFDGGILYLPIYMIDQLERFL